MDGEPSSPNRAQYLGRITSSVDELDTACGSARNAVLDQIVVGGVLAQEQAAAYGGEGALEHRRRRSRKRLQEDKDVCAEYGALSAGIVVIHTAEIACPTQSAALNLPNHCSTLAHRQQYSSGDTADNLRRQKSTGTRAAAADLATRVPNL